MAVGIRQLRPWARRRAAAASGLLIAACGLLAAACGSAAAPATNMGGMHGGTGGSASTTSAAKVALDVTLSGANSPAQHWTLRCDPAGGTHPDPAAACNILLTHRNLFQRPALKIMCPMIMANARTYTVTGVFFGHRVHEIIVDGGCDLARWSTLNHIFN
jgi:hypothetical protein